MDTQDDTRPGTRRLTRPQRVAHELLDALRELIAAGDNCVSPTGGCDVAAMLRFAKADKAARAVVAKAGG